MTIYILWSNRGTCQGISLVVTVQTSPNAAFVKCIKKGKMPCRANIHNFSPLFYIYFNERSTKEILEVRRARRTHLPQLLLEGVLERQPLCMLLGRGHLRIRGGSGFRAFIDLLDLFGPLPHLRIVRRLCLEMVDIAQEVNPTPLMQALVPNPDGRASPRDLPGLSLAPGRHQPGAGARSDRCAAPTPGLSPGHFFPSSP